MFGKTYSLAFFDGLEPHISFTWEWERLLEKDLKTGDWDDDINISQIIFGSDEIIEELHIGLHMDRREWAGPDVIRLSFSIVAKDRKMIKMGEGVFRNSGTSPKNSGYNKLWPFHPVRNIQLSDGRLRELLDDLATRRAQWTDNYVKAVLRK
jgi:hypothetical protein